MKKQIFATLGLAAALLLPLAGWAGDPGERRGFRHGPGRCATVEDLSLTAEQRKGVERAEHLYRESMRTLRNQSTSRRLEFRGLLADPAVGEEAIRAKAKELQAAQAEVQRVVLDYRLRVRAVLRPDQLSRWCAGPAWLRGPGDDSCLDP